jgi:hypothetical protein
VNYFIGAKDLIGGQVIVAEIIEAKDFDEAVRMAEDRAAEVSRDGHYRLTAVNEQIDIGRQRSGVRSQTAEFLEGARA